MTLHTETKAQRKLLTKLRLSVADWVAFHRLQARNIESAPELHEQAKELCDQYSLCALVSWLAEKASLLKPRQNTEEKNGKAVERDAARSCVECSVERAEEARVPSRRSDYKKYQDIEKVFIDEIEYPFVDRLAPEEICSLRSMASEIFDDRLQPSVALVGTLYELLMQRTPLPSLPSSGKSIIDVSGPHIEDNVQRRLNGQFYTPPYVVDYCLEQALQRDSRQLMNRIQSNFQSVSIEDILDYPCASSCFKICDPSCGTGNFLVGILKWLKTSGLAPAQMLAFLSSSIFGLELDGRAAALARCSLILAVLDELSVVSANDPSEAARKLLRRLRENIIVVDTLLASSAGCKMQQNFDLVVTNPPYVSYGARNQPKVAPSLSRFLKLEYKASAEYKIRIHSIFQECALRLTKPGGQAVLLVPDAFLTGQYYQGLRREIVRQARIVSISELPDDTISDATVGQWCVAVYRKSSRDIACADDYDVDLYSVSDWSAESSLKRYKLPFSVFVSKDRSRFRVMFDDLDRSIATRLDRLAPLGSCVRGHTGIRATSGQRKITSNAPLSSTWQRGIDSGAQVIRHKTNWSGTWINVDPSNLYGGGFDPNVIQNPKLLVRQTGDRIIAAYDEEGLYHLNNVHSFSTNGIKGPASGNGIKQGKGNQKDQLLLNFNNDLNLSTVGSRDDNVLSKDWPVPDLHYLDGLMNSNAWLYLYQMKTRESGRALAQIDIESLESLVVPPHNPALELRISELVRQYSTLIGLQQNSDVDACEMIDRLIDRLVYRLYDFSDEEVQHIENYCQNRTRKNNCSSNTEFHLPSTQELEEKIEEMRHLTTGTVSLSMGVEREIGYNILNKSTLVQ